MMVRPPYDTTNTGYLLGLMVYSKDNSIPIYIPGEKVAKVEYTLSKDTGSMLNDVIIVPVTGRPIRVENPKRWVLSKIKDKILDIVYPNSPPGTIIELYPTKTHPKSSGELNAQIFKVYVSVPKEKSTI